MSRESYLIPRRSFLRGVGAALALPSLEIMSPALGYGNSRRRRIFAFVSSLRELE